MVPAGSCPLADLPGLATTQAITGGLCGSQNAGPPHRTGHAKYRHRFSKLAGRLADFASSPRGAVEIEARTAPARKRAARTCALAGTPIAKLAKTKPRNFAAAAWPALIRASRRRLPKARSETSRLLGFREGSREGSPAVLISKYMSSLDDGCNNNRTIRVRGCVHRREPDLRDLHHILVAAARPRCFHVLQADGVVPQARSVAQAQPSGGLLAAGGRAKQDLRLGAGQGQQRGHAPAAGVLPRSEAL